MTTEYLTPKETAGLLKVDRLTVYRMIKDGRLPAARIGKRGWRISREAVTAVLQPAVRS